MKKIVLIDGNSLLFRAFYATQYGSGAMMKTSFGVSTNAIYAFANMMLSAIKMEQPDYIAVAFDAGKQTFRHQMYEDYKAGRKETPSELVQQFSVSREFLDAFNIKHYEADSFEADDIVATLAKQGEQIGNVVIFTSDRDLLQCVSDHTTVSLLIKGMKDIQAMTPQTLLETKGVTPTQITDLKGLMGDKSDNLPGIPKVGEKSAQKLLQEYHSLENIIANVSNIKGKLGENIAQYQQQAITCKELATIKCDCELPFSIEDCAINLNYATLYDFFMKYEMKSLATRIEDNIELNQPTNDDVDLQVVSSIDPSFLNQPLALVVDCNTGLFDNIEVYGIAFGTKECIYYMDFEDVKNNQDIINWLQDETSIKYMYDAKRSLNALYTFNVTLKGIKEDVMILASLADSTCTTQSKIASRFELRNNISIEQLYGKFDKPKMRDLFESQAYCKAMVLDIYTLLDCCLPMIESFNCQSLYYDIELPLMYVLTSMEQEGVVCRKDILASIASELDTQIQELTQIIFGHAGHAFNINSPKQLATVLFDELLLPTINNKKRSTSAEVLDTLSGTHPIIDALQRYRKLGKIYSTYAIGLDKYICNDHKIHTTFNQAATQTGRLSSSDPNLQNISVRDEEGRLIRKAFVPSDGHVLLSCDYSQIELRMLAHMANEQKLIDAFRHGKDIHTQTAMDVFGLSEDQMDSEHRRKAKAVNFGIVYGISDFGLATQLGISRKEAQTFIDTYLKTYPGIQGYMDNIVASCEENGYVTTLMNRRREIPEIHDKSYAMRSFGKRAAMNAPIQGSAADLIKIAMLKVDEAMKKANVKSKMILQVHDELIFDVAKDEVDIMVKLVEDTMEHAMDLSVPLKAECKVGNDWYEAK